MAKAKKKVKVSTPPLAARLKVLDKCGIDRSRVGEPKVKAALGHYFREMRKVIEEPIEIEDIELRNPPGACSASRVNSTISTAKVWHDRGGVR